jgi:hypothetical protein
MVVLVDMLPSMASEPAVRCRPGSGIGICALLVLQTPAGMCAVNICWWVQATASGLYIAEKIDLLVAYVIAQPLGNLLVKYFPQVRHSWQLLLTAQHRYAACLA